MSDLVTDAGGMELPAQASAAERLEDGSVLGPELAVPVIGLATRCAKRALDIAVSLTLLLLLSPLMLLVALALARTGRPILFAQERVGFGGHVFHCLKFRSMVPGAEEILERLLQQDPELRREWSETQKLKVDFRVTRFGAVLRKTSIDELPQLWNVLCGEMSLVGPRPALPKQLPMYGTQAVLYTAVRPGMTGLWQVNARGDGDFQRRVQYDTDYVRSCSFWNDIALLARTVAVVISGKGAY
jgi:undecaprenyl-phosphate galactose phosphotransferase